MLCDKRWKRQGVSVIESLYGLKQAHRSYACIDSYPHQNGFVRACCYVKENKNGEN